MDKSTILRRLEYTDKRSFFDCGDDDLNEFFAKDSIVAGRELLSVTYSVEKDNSVLAFFSVSNDSIKKEILTKSKYKKVSKIIPHEKRYSSLPAVKIGRLACCKTAQKNGLGTSLLDFIKVWFTVGNKTGCRFIVVDAYNEPYIIKFYKTNGFNFLVEDDDKDEKGNPSKTRLMYFDLITFRK